MVEVKHHIFPKFKFENLHWGENKGVTKNSEMAKRFPHLGQLFEEFIEVLSLPL